MKPPNQVSHRYRSHYVTRVPGLDNRGDDDGRDPVFAAQAKVERPVGGAYPWPPPRIR